MSLRAGDRAPKSVRIVLTDSSLDMTTVTSVELETCTPAGNHVAWSWAIAAATTSTLTLDHVLAPNGSDVQDAGDYVVTGVLHGTVDRDIEPVTFSVAAPAC